MGISSSKGRERQGWHPMTAKSTNLLLLLPLFIQWSHSHLITIRWFMTSAHLPNKRSKLVHRVFPRPINLLRFARFHFVSILYWSYNTFCLYSW
ncbi:hypothetical protein HanXRQr2_Chr10g0461751 [Helianthus annuus]|uniref:Uncharacterized protein n=1 Tax=Helianthus annuus TaxID=4232 RepID=A0A9K3I1I6_HELAN|nr:hypothetical protein HanXRQr2_Chr10g0461751 [Helianthus annuus]KAJ0885479.1 hypothetical protein HanPSC8_Chr10g0445671 [Helianthus annuus]